MENAEKKKSRLPVIIVLVLLIAAGAGGFYYYHYQNLPSTRIGKLHQKADSLIGAGDHAAALDVLEDVRTLETEETEEGGISGRTIRQFEDIFDAQAEGLMKVESGPKYLAIYNVYNEGKRLVPEDQNFYDIRICETLRNWSNAVIESSAGTYDEAAELLSLAEYASSSGIPGLENTVIKLKNRIRTLASEKILAELAVKFAAAAEKNDIDRMLKLYTDNISSSSEFIETVVGSGQADASGRIVSTRLPEKGKTFALYYRNATIFIYYGDVDAEGRRDGKGIWLAVRSNSVIRSFMSYFYSGDWKNDLPNGSMSAQLNTVFQYNGIREEKTAEASVKNGLYNGKVTYTYNGDKKSVYTVTYKNGDPVKIGTTKSRQGEKLNVYAYNKDKSKPLTNLQSGDGVYGTY